MVLWRDAPQSEVDNAIDNLTPEMREVYNELWPNIKISLDI